MFPVAPINGQIFTDAISGLSFVYDSTLSIWNQSPVAGGGAQIFYEQKVVAANGQTAFNTLSIPNLATTVVMNINGVDYFQPDFTVAGNFVTWAGPVTIEMTDKVVISYT